MSHRAVPADVDACGDLDEDALRTGQLAALSSLEGLGQRRLGALLVRHRPDELVRCIADGTVALHDDGWRMARSDVARWRAELGDDVVTTWAQRCRSLGVRAVTPDDDEFPHAVRLDERPPPVLFVNGAMPPESMRHAAIVGTRNATSRGREFARQLGRELATSGVVVVSGLARGIDAAAHLGALDAPDVPLVGVIGNGHGAPYPRSNAALWDEVAARGAVLGEWPPGTPPDAFRFPLRNRIVAALAEVVIVVESRETGGSLITALAAAERGLTVMAVPGDPRARSSRGTNELIRDGAVPVTSTDDVLAAMSLCARPGRIRSVDPRPRPRGVEADVFERVRAVPCTLDQLVTELGITISGAAMAVARLERTGWVRELDGWFEVVADHREPAR